MHKMCTHGANGALFELEIESECEREGGTVRAHAMCVQMEAPEITCQNRLRASVPHTHATHTHTRTHIGLELECHTQHIIHILCRTRSRTGNVAIPSSHHAHYRSHYNHQRNICSATDFLHPNVCARPVRARPLLLHCWACLCPPAFSASASRIGIRTATLFGLPYIPHMCVCARLRKYANNENTCAA